MSEAHVELPSFSDIRKQEDSRGTQGLVINILRDAISREDEIRLIIETQKNQQEQIERMAKMIGELVRQNSVLLNLLARKS